MRVTAHRLPFVGRCRHQSGGAITLLLALLAVGILLYFALHRGAGPGSPAGDTGQALDCEPLISRLVQQTGGAGPQAKAAYDALPAPCRKLLPDPAALAPSPERQAPDQ